MSTENIISESSLWAKRPGERGQAVVLVMVVLGLLVLVAVALAVDYSYLFFHRQAAQNAADAACTAGVMDMLAVYNNAPTGTGGISPNFTTGTAFDCYTATTATPCWYATANNYSSTLTRAQATATGSTAGINVYVSFPDKSACPAGSACPVPGITPATVITNSLMKVEVIDRARVFFLGLLSSNHTIDVKAASICGLVNVKVSAPIGLLAPTGTSLDNKGVITIIGGTDLTFAVNSSSSTAVSVTGSGKINLYYGGSDFCGGQLLVFGGPTTPPTGFSTSTTLCPSDTSCPSPAPTCTGGTARGARWVSPGAPAGDPFSTFAAPSTSGLPTDPTPTDVNGGQEGCPEAPGTNCKKYTKGVYTSQIQIKNKTAIFDPGVYYVTGGLVLDTGSCVRPSTNTGDGTGGTTFYFSDNNTVSSAGNGGDCTGKTDFTTSNIKCTASVSLPNYIPSTVSNVSVLMAPCTGTYGDPNPDADDLTKTPNGRQRGILFFQNRSQKVDVNLNSNNPFMTAGAWYIHQCTAGAAGAADPGASATCSSSAYQSKVWFKGNMTSASYVLGAIVTDNMDLSGGTSIKMGLVNNAAYSIIKAALLR